MINVSKPFLPPIGEYINHVRNIWKTNWITNHGPLVKTFEKEIKKHFDIEYMCYTSNGTIALQIALKTLGKGEVITTPYSYAATVNSIIWENLTPKFVDIDLNTFNIDPNKISAAINEKTVAILPTFVYGNACDTDAIAQIAQLYNIKTIYDAAHAFGSSYKGKSLYKFGDISITSFHATKIYHTTEGGAIFSRDLITHEKVKKMMNFGHSGPNEFELAGINGKNTEFHAAMGLSILPYIKDLLEKRKYQYSIYYSHLQNTTLRFQKIVNIEGYNYSYFPIVFETHSMLKITITKLNSQHIFPRRYFSPSLNLLSYLPNEDFCPISENISNKILCLPLYHSLEIKEQEKIIRIIKSSIK
ncbi:UNVERIFIED_CONTAM: hypothetical protein GTU68_035597 [Idotea baltica]|nr:hypothetical protein [Idotea baltica]